MSTPARRVRRLGRPKRPSLDSELVDYVAFGQCAPFFSRFSILTRFAAAGVGLVNVSIHNELS
jgi:hypothetical protein